MKQETALVLGGGGSRGLAHIGVLKVLEREEIDIDFIVGTSMGAIIGALYALGFGLDEIGDGLEKTMKPKTLQENTRQKIGFISSKARQRQLSQQLEVIMADKTFADLRIPMSIMAVDMVHGEEIVLQQGPLIPALLASSAVPGVFPPVSIDGKQLADGGVIDSLATHVAVEQGAANVIAVDVYPALETDDPWNDPISAIMGFQLPPFALFNGNGQKPKEKTPNMVSSLWRSIRVQTWSHHQTRLADNPPDILMRPNVDHYGSLDFTDISGPIDAGIEEAETHIEALRALKQAVVKMEK